MTSTESHTPTREDFVRWGTAPEDRQCRYQFANGYHCRRWSVRGHEFCHKHGVWMASRVDGPIEIPLLEDPTAVQFVATQTVRALSWGHIPPANGRAILHGCRVIQTGFAQQLAEARFRLKCHRLGVDANQFLPARAPGDPEHPVGMTTEPDILSEAQSAEPSVILSEARSAQSKDLHSSPENRVPHPSPVLEEVGEPGAPFKPSSGLSGLDQASHPTTLDLQASTDPETDAPPPLSEPPIRFSRRVLIRTTFRRDQGDVFKKRNIRVPHPCPPAVGGQGGLADH